MISATVTIDNNGVRYYLCCDVRTYMYAIVNWSWARHCWYVMCHRKRKYSRLELHPCISGCTSYFRGWAWARKNNAHTERFCDARKGAYRTRWFSMTLSATVPQTPVKLPAEKSYRYIQTYACFIHLHVHSHHWNWLYIAWRGIKYCHTTKESELSWTIYLHVVLQDVYVNTCYITTVSCS